MKRWYFRLRLWVYKWLIRLGIKQDEIYYIGGSEALPPPLSREEERELLERLPKGDKAARAMLIERNLRLVVYIARKFENTGLNIEDLISIGTIGLIKAVNTFDPEKKIKLATYASRCIENEILMHLRKSNKLKTEVSFDEPLNVDWDGNELLLSDILGTEEDLITKGIEKKIDKKLLLSALEQLNDREKQIMELRFGLIGKKEKTQKDVADMMGISQSYISRLEKKIIRRLQREFDKMV
ncbi:RNA polymerase sporulation sigma factor SigE [Halobacillus salinus]|uniref:RNA polymerase sigma factor n=1 Tax=Halobacillus salinus TaxID=192814 RepID=A0A4Z0H7I5_9BACI|nr:RNA polymerase sporulation sigma factor SigE [Halobacillus salinus]TGB04996.1 RNA polymerase sporulation sigma factor SigE [Halobacillus salinus]